MKAGFKKSRPKLETLESESRDVRTTRKNRLDPLTEALGCSGFQYNMRWTWLTYNYGGVTHPLSVSRFYPERNLAVDIGAIPVEILQHKRELCKENGVVYTTLANEWEFKKMLTEVRP